MPRPERNSQMSLKIRLARARTKKPPGYNIGIAGSPSPRDGRLPRRLRYFNPVLPEGKAGGVRLGPERVRAGRAKGGLPTARVRRFRDQPGVRRREKRTNPPRAAPRKQRKAQAEEAAKAAAAAKPAAPAGGAPAS